MLVDNGATSPSGFEHIWRTDKKWFVGFVQLSITSFLQDPNTPNTEHPNNPQVFYRCSRDQQLRRQSPHRFPCACVVVIRSPGCWICVCLPDVGCSCCHNLRALAACFFTRLLPFLRSSRRSLRSLSDRIPHNPLECIVQIKKRRSAAVKLNYHTTRKYATKKGRCTIMVACT